MGQHFTVWRPPHERLASLYVGSIRPAKSGFYHPWEAHDIHEDMSFVDYIETICDLPELNCDEHFVVYDYWRVVPHLDIYDFHAPDTWPVGKPERIGPSYADQQPTYSKSLLDLVYERYREEYMVYEVRLLNTEASRKTSA